MPRSRGASISTVGGTPTVDIAETQARCLKYRLILANLPLARDIDDFDFADTSRPRRPAHAANRPTLVTGVKRGRPFAPPRAIVCGTAGSETKRW